ncbi:hypothetical protein Peur_059392 [Populus x canadensis]
MEIAKYPSACLPLAFALLLCFAVSTESQSYGHGGNQDQIRADDVQSRWCIAKPSAYNFELLRNIDYSCGQNGVDCGQIQPGGSCFRPDTTFGHASYAMNLFFKAAGKHPWDCHFNGTGIVVTQDPSFGTCTYPLSKTPFFVKLKAQKFSPPITFQNDENDRQGSKNFIIASQLIGPSFASK